MQIGGVSLLEGVAAHVRKNGADSGLNRPKSVQVLPNQAANSSEIGYRQGINRVSIALFWPDWANFEKISLFS